MTAARFDGDRALDLVIVDANPVDSQQRPRIRILRGEGEGKFSRIQGVPDIILEAGETPVAIVTGQFKLVDERRPSDLVIASKTASGGTLKLFLNDGSGRLSASLIKRLSFEPRQVASSNKFRDGGIYDVIVSDRHGFLFLENSGAPEFVRRQHFNGPPEDDESLVQLIVGNVNEDDFDDIIIIDQHCHRERRQA